jgi:hypothetical protein
MTPDELKAHVTDLLSKGVPIRQDGGRVGKMKFVKSGITRIETDTVGKKLTRLSSKSTWDNARAIQARDWWDDNPYTGVSKDACQQATLTAHPYMPKGSRIVKMMRSEGEEDGGNHFIHVVPTTEGPHVVDFTHGQFDENVDGPIVEPLDKYNERKAAQFREARRTIPTRVANRLAESNAYGDTGSIYNQNRRDAIKAEQYEPSDLITMKANPPQKVNKAKLYKG